MHQRRRTRRGGSKKRDGSAYIGSSKVSEKELHALMHTLTRADLTAALPPTKLMAQTNSAYDVREVFRLCRSPARRMKLQKARDKKSSTPTARRRRRTAQDVDGNPKPRDVPWHSVYRTVDLACQLDVNTLGLKPKSARAKSATHRRRRQQEDEEEDDADDGEEYDDGEDEAEDFLRHGYGDEEDDEVDDDDDDEGSDASDSYDGNPRAGGRRAVRPDDVLLDEAGSLDGELPPDRDADEALRSAMGALSSATRSGTASSGAKSRKSVLDEVVAQNPYALTIDDPMRSAGLDVPRAGSSPRPLAYVEPSAAPTTSTSTPRKSNKSGKKGGGRKTPSKKRGGPKDRPLTPGGAMTPLPGAEAAAEAGHGGPGTEGDMDIPTLPGPLEQVEMSVVVVSKLHQHFQRWSSLRFKPLPESPPAVPLRKEWRLPSPPIPRPEDDADFDVQAKYIHECLTLLSIFLDNVDVALVVGAREARRAALRQINSLSAFVDEWVTTETKRQQLERSAGVPSSVFSSEASRTNKDGAETASQYSRGTSAYSDSVYSGSRYSGSQSGSEYGDDDDNDGEDYGSDEEEEEEEDDDEDGSTKKKKRCVIM